MKRVVICDDEDDARLLIRQYLGDYTGLQIAFECNNGVDAVAIIDDIQPDLVFLDIQMPGLNGFEVLQKISYIPLIIFSTAFDNYALKAFDSNAVDYLLKPYTKARFAQAIKKITFDHTKNLEGIRNLTHQLTTERILVESGSRMIAISVGDICWIEADGDYTRIHTQSKFYISKYGITTLAAKLNPSVFMRIHRSAIINLHMIKAVVNEAGGCYVQLNNGVKHKVGRTYTAAIRKLVV